MPYQVILIIPMSRFWVRHLKARLSYSLMIQYIRNDRNPNYMATVKQQSSIFRQLDYMKTAMHVYLFCMDQCPWLPILGPGASHGCTFWFCSSSTKLIQIINLESSFNYLNKLCSARAKTKTCTPERPRTELGKPWIGVYTHILYISHIHHSAKYTSLT